MASITSDLRWNRRSVISNFIADEESIDADLRDGELGQEGAERLYFFRVGSDDISHISLFDSKSVLNKIILFIFPYVR